MLALLGAAAWGVGDFLGGLGARRVNVLTVLFVSQAAGLAGVFVWATVSRDPLPGAGDALPAAAAGAAGLVGLGALPWLRGRRDGDRRPDLGSLTSRAARGGRRPREPPDKPPVGRNMPRSRRGRRRLPRALAFDGNQAGRGAGLAIVAALGFGVFIVGIDAAADASVPWTVVSARAASVLLALAVALATRTALTSPRHLLPLLLAVGVFDTGANVLVAAATTHGSAGIVAVLSALNPVTTIRSRPVSARRAAFRRSPHRRRDRPRRRGTRRRRMRESALSAWPRRTGSPPGLPCTARPRRRIFGIDLGAGARSSASALRTQALDDEVEAWA
jgi:hypothetical protein